VRMGAGKFPGTVAAAGTSDRKHYNYQIAKTNDSSYRRQRDQEPCCYRQIFFLLFCFGWAIDLVKHSV